MTSGSVNFDCGSWICHSALAKEAQRIAADPLNRGLESCKGRHFLDLVHDHLVRILADPVVLASVRAASYRHPLGFTKLVLWQGDYGRRLRVHIWEGPEVYGDVHDHFWDFRSVVLRGAIDFAHYRTKQGTLYQEYRMTPRGNGSFETEASGTTGLDVTRNVLSLPFQQYALGSDVLHAAKPVGRPISLVFQGGRIRLENRILRKRPVLEPCEHRAEPLPMAELTSLLARLASWCMFAARNPGRRVSDPGMRAALAG